MSIELGTKQKALREANGLLQRFGFNGFSFQHIADSLGIKKPSLYAHFESKEALGLDLIEMHKQWLQNWAESMSELEPDLKIAAYFDMFYRFAQKGGLYCPIATLTAESHSLSPSMKKRLKVLHESQMNWLRRAIDDGQSRSLFRKDLPCEDLVEFIVALGIGGQFLGRISSEADKLKMVKKQALLFLKAE